MSNIERKLFSEIDVNNSFFDSLKTDYAEFSSWYSKKALQGEKAFILYDNLTIRAFLYLKVENEAITDVLPSLDAKPRLKIGTMKIDAHGTKLGERCIKRIFDTAMKMKIYDLYVTVFEKHIALRQLLETFGFTIHGTKETTNGKEMVYTKNIRNISGERLKDYPLVNVSSNIHVLSIYPEFHTRLFSDSILNNESVDILKDVSHTNSIHKLYICAMKKVMTFKKGDTLLIYRTSDKAGAAKYRSVVTSICVVEEILNINEFTNKVDFIHYCEKYSIFSRQELGLFYDTKKYPYLIRMTYNVSLSKRVTNGHLVDNLGVNPDYWGVFDINREQFDQIIRAGEVDESFIVN